MTAGHTATLSATGPARAEPAPIDTTSRPVPAVAAATARTVAAPPTTDATPDEATAAPFAVATVSTARKPATKDGTKTGTGDSSGNKGASAPALPAPDGAAVRNDSATVRPAFALEALPPPAAQAATQYAAAGNAFPAQAPVRPPVPAQQLADPLVRVAQTGGGTFRIELKPAELGRVQVEADVSEGQVRLKLQAERADTLDLLRADVRHLERALGDAGLRLDGASVHFSLRNDDGARGFAGFGGGTGPGAGAGGGDRQPARHGSGPEQPPSRPEPSAVPLDGLVDVTV